MILSDHPVLKDLCLIRIEDSLIAGRNSDMLEGRWQDHWRG